MTPEIWKPIKEFPNYEISNHGRIKSLAKSYQRFNQNRCQIINQKERILNPYKRKSSKGNYYYFVISLRANNQTFTLKVHRLMLQTFIGECPIGMEGCHNDGNSLNNHISNLRWDTPKNNALDKKNHGTQTRKKSFGEQNNAHKINKNDVIYIRSSKQSNIDLAFKFNIRKETISRIKNGKSWPHITEHL